ncbi:MAG: hypothetical protein KJ661_05870 [Candidatus Omnitrophica bacterium]|nr:hypothetical protein [Candidatus Omnitrophota bacterium]
MTKLTNILIVIRAIIGLIFGIVILAVIVFIFGKFYAGLFTPSERFGIEATVSVLLVALLIWLYRSRGKRKPRIIKVSGKVLNGEYLMAQDVDVLIQAKNMDKGALLDMIADKRLSYSHEGQEVEILGESPHMDYVRVAIKDTGKRVWVESDAVRVEKACAKGDV